MPAKIIAFTLLCFAFSTALAGGWFVGNGGEGVIQGSQVYLRDLVEAGLEKTPSLGEEKNADIDSALHLPLLADEPEVHDLLLKKLTDIENRAPHLGYYFAAAISHYNWVLIDIPLTPQVPSGSPVVIGDKNLVPLANRLRSTIRLSKSGWPLLNPENKVALILHEMVSAAFWVDCVKEKCEQSIYGIRDFTAKLFAGADHPLYEGQIETNGVLNLSRDNKWVGCRIETKPKVVLNKTKEFAPAKPQTLAESVCRDIQSSGLTSLTMYRRPYYIREKTYTTVAGEDEDYKQVYIQMNSVASESTLQTSSGVLEWSKDFDACVGVLRTEFATWFEYKPNSTYLATDRTDLKCAN